MATEVRVGEPIGFLGYDDAGRVQLERVLVDSAEGGLIRIIVSTDVATAHLFEERQAFHNAPESRLEELEHGFDTDLPVYFDLGLRPEVREQLPRLSGELVRDALVGAAALPALARDDAWNAALVWQERQLPPLLGGGTMKVGYRTSFSEPRNEIDRLKRRGPVSHTIVEAFVENNLPVHFDEDRGAFELKFGVVDRTYSCSLEPDDQSMAITLVTESNGPIGQPAAAKEVVRQCNAALPLGELELAGATLRYTMRMEVDQTLLGPAWIMESIRTGVSVTDRCARQID